MNKIFLVLLALPLIFLSCNNHQDSKETVKQDTPIKKKTEIIKTAGLYKNIRCQSNPQYSYAIYLPQNYSQTKTFPTLFLFDAHGEGSLPLEKYKSLADSMDILLCCSNNIKNGIPKSALDEIAFLFFQDVKARFQVNENQIFIGGFSGGARMSSIIANQNKNIKAWISCGAGPASIETEKPPQYTIAMLAGTKDFNYKEVYRVHQVFNKYKINNVFISFNDIHKWPNAKDFADALYYSLIRNFDASTDSIYQNKIMKQYLRFEEMQLKEAQLNHDKFKMVAIYERMHITLKDTQLTSPYENQYSKWMNASAYLIYQKNWESIFQQEDQYQKQLGQIFQNPQPNNLTLIDQILNEKNTAHDSLMKYMYERLQAYMSIMAFSYSNQAIQKNRLDLAQNYLHLYAKVDPKNTEVYYMKAKVLAMQNQQHQAMVNLEKAVALGFRDFDRIRTDQAFSFSDIEMDIIKKGAEND